MIRAFDIIFSAIALLLLAPMFAIVALVLRFTGEGEILYFQPRVGKDRSSFNIIKFATMKKESPTMGAGTITVKDDPRVLPVGRFLRATKINELPQIMNIFRGDMSVIGPRPLTEDAYQYYSEEGVKFLTSVRPGLSGIGSIIFRDEERILSRASNPRDFHKRVIGPYKELLETWSIQNMSLWTYFLFIFLTVHAVVFSKSKLVWRIFPSLPKPEGEIKDFL